MSASHAARLNADLRARPNALGAFRLGLAALVVVSHSWQLGGYGEQLKVGSTYLSTWGLFGFFVLSGFLITRSRLARPSVGQFALARFLRIYPGFAVCLLIVAFVFAPVSQVLDPGADYHLRSAAEYVMRNAPLYPPFVHQPGIADTLGAVPFAGNWDEPMWSLFYEASCYALVGLVVSIFARSRSRVAIPVLFVVATAGAFISSRGIVVLPYEYSIGLVLVTLFLGGSTLCVLGDHIPVARWDVLVSGGVLAVVVLLGLEGSFAALPLAHLLIRASLLVPFTRVGRRWDISYGVYIYGVPVQQLVVLAFPNQTLPLWAFIAIVFVGLIPIAFASTALVEMPALRLKDLRLGDLLMGRVRLRRSLAAEVDASRSTLDGATRPQALAAAEPTR